MLCMLVHCHNLFTTYLNLNTTEQSLLLSVTPVLYLLRVIMSAVKNLTFWTVQVGMFTAGVGFAVLIELERLGLFFFNT